MTASVRQRQVAGAYLSNVEILAVAAAKVGIPFYAACALVDMESEGKNVYGHDAGGALSGYPGEVNAENYAVFRWLVIDKKGRSNGVGPCQLTWRGFFPDMESKGLKPYDVHDNMVYGLGLFWGYYKASKSWTTAGRKYNGALTYGRTMAKRVSLWHDRVGG